jgi:hypothetical protein
MLPVGGRNVLRGAQRWVRAKSARGLRHVRVGIRPGLPRSARHGAVRGAGQLHHSTLDSVDSLASWSGELGRIPGIAEQISKDCPVLPRGAADPGRSRDAERRCSPGPLLCRRRGLMQRNRGIETVVNLG